MRLGLGLELVLGLELRLGLGLQLGLRLVCIYCVLRMSVQFWACANNFGTSTI